MAAVTTPSSPLDLTHVSYDKCVASLQSRPGSIRADDKLDFECNTPQQKSRPDIFFILLYTHISTHIYSYVSIYEDTIFIHAFRDPNDLVSRFRELGWNHDCVGKVDY